MTTSRSTRNIAPKPIGVAVGVVSNARGEVLINQRPVTRPHGGKWEFPGGKIEAGEEAGAALTRELREELGITVSSARPLLNINHTYPEKSVILRIYRVTAYRGVPQSLEGQKLAWVRPAALAEFDFLEANVPIIRALRLPPVYGITDSARFGVKETLAQLERALAAGLRLVQVREKHMPEPALAEFFRQVYALCRPVGASVLLNANPGLALRWGADGVHLDSRRLMLLDRRPLPRELWIAASCHNPGELDRAATIGADFAVLSPVKVTASHAGTPPLGWRQFGEWARSAELPVYALGGMHPADLDTAHTAGAVGIAMIRGVADLKNVCDPD